MCLIVERWTICKRSVVTQYRLFDDSVRFHLLDIVLKRFLDEYHAKVSSEKSSFPCCVLGEPEANQHLFSPAKRNLRVGSTYLQSSRRSEVLSPPNSLSHAYVSALSGQRRMRCGLSDLRRMGYIEMLQPNKTLPPKKRCEVDEWVQRPNSRTLRMKSYTFSRSDFCSCVKIKG
jgi:hypothetical protein